SFERFEVFLERRISVMTMAVTRPFAMSDLSAYTSTSEDRVVLIDSEGTIVGVNDKWLALAERSRADLRRVGPGANYLEVCWRAKSSSVDALEAEKGIRAVLKGKLRSFTMDYCGNLPSSGLHYFRMGVTPIQYGAARFVVAHTDITELRLSKERSL